MPAELQRISGAAPSADELIETERRVADLATAGRSNKQIGAEPHITVYRKPGAAFRGHSRGSVVNKQSRDGS